MKREFSQNNFFFPKNAPNTKFHENPSSGKCVVSRGRRDGQTDTMKLIVVFAILRTVPKLRLSFQYFFPEPFRTPIHIPVSSFTYRSHSLRSSDVVRVHGHCVCHLAYFSLRLPCRSTVGELVGDTVYPAIDKLLCSQFLWCWA